MHGIDHVFQHARAGNRAVFGNVSDQYHGDAHLFRHARQFERRIRAPATRSRGRKVIWSEYMVWMESMTTTSG